METGRAIKHRTRFPDMQSTLLPGSCLLMLLVGVAAATCSDDVSRFGEFGCEESVGSRRLLVVNGMVRMARSLRDDAELLLEIKRMITADPENATFSWKPHGRDRTLNPCKMVKAKKHYWQGIDCTHFGRERRVTAIDISGKRLAGNLSPALGKLSRLKHFNVSNNLFRGPVPALGKLSRLKHFDASNNLFTGPVPVHFPAGLETLDLANNHFERALPALIGNLGKLTSLNVANNRVTGAIPTSLGNLQFLSTLNMSGNNLTDTISADLNLCLRLTVVDLSRNGLSGVLPRTLASLVVLTTFNVSDNKIGGELPSLANAASLRIFDASFNNLTGAVAKLDFMNQTALSYLNVSYNNLSGLVPSFDERDGVNRSSFLHNLALCGKNLGLRDCASSSSSDSTTIKIVSILVGSSVAFIVMVILVYICWRRYSEGKVRSCTSVSAELDMKLTPEEVQRETQNYPSRNYAGVGSMSTVYRGVLPDATVVAVKRLGVLPGKFDAVGEKVRDDGLQTLAQVSDWTMTLKWCFPIL